MKNKYLASVILLLIIINNTIYSNLVLNTNNIDSVYNQAITIAVVHPDSSIMLLNKCFAYYSINKDTANMLECFIKIIEINKINLSYSDAYDNTWDALLIAEKYNSSFYKSRLYENLGALYNMFGNEEKSYLYLNKALTINKSLIEQDSIEGQVLISSYFNHVMLFNMFLKQDIAQKYLDTCYYLADKFEINEIKKGYLDAEQGAIYRLQGKLNEAEEILIQVKEIFERIKYDTLFYNNDVSYLVIIYSFLGDIYMLKKSYHEATKYYDDGLAVSYKLNAHAVMRTDLLFKASQAYSYLNQFEIAYRKISLAKKLNDDIFGSRSTQNKALLEIKNKYREDIQRKNLELSLKTAELLTKEKNLLRIKVIISIFLFSLIIIGLIIRNRLQQKKHEAKQKEVKDRLALRNKELTSYTLQFIEKEKIIMQLIKSIKEGSRNLEKHKTIIKEAEKGTKKYWNEFNDRFVRVNQDFYNHLRSKHPGLTSTDLKLCALIKLNFSAKEMAHLLGISATSVNMSRYRLRKKMNLSRDVNLSAYITTL